MMRIYLRFGIAAIARPQTTSKMPTTRRYHFDGILISMMAVNGKTLAYFTYSLRCNGNYKHITINSRHSRMFCLCESRQSEYVVAFCCVGSLVVHTGFCVCGASLQLLCGAAFLVAIARNMRIAPKTYNRERGTTHEYIILLYRYMPAKEKHTNGAHTWVRK